MKKLISGIVDFRKNVRPAYKDTFAQLALGQKPDTLFIACSDSRVAVNVFASTDPGDLFVVRNVGNLIPPCGEAGRSLSDESEAAAIEFALLTLPVDNIIVCGHSECGAMGALVAGHAPDQAPNLSSWLKNGECSLRKLNAGSKIGTHLEKHNQLSQVNVLEQIEHLKTYPLVLERLQQKKLTLHAWWFDIRGADVYEFDLDSQQFRLIDSTYAQQLLERATER